MTPPVTQYSDEIESAAQDIADAGAAITFTRVTNAQDESTGVTTPVTTTASSVAIRVKPFRTDYMRLEVGGLTLSNPVTLLVAGSGLAFDPLPGDKFGWGPNTFVVRNVDTVGPDGTAIVHRIVGSV